MAGKAYSWNVNVDGMPYKIEFIKNKVFINNNDPIKLGKFKSKSKFPNMEYHIPLGSKEVVLNVRSVGEPVLTMDGRNCVTGELFAFSSMPKWTWLFIVLHGINLFFLIGGAIGGACFGGLTVMTAAIATNEEMSTKKRVILCLVIWMVATMLEYILALFIARLMYY